jgi:hypothetical protein
MPEPVRTAALTLIATEYRRGTLGDNRYGVRSRRLGDFQEAFTETNGGSALNVSMEMRNELDRYKNWKLF